MHISPNGSNLEALQVLITIVTEYSANIHSSYLNRSEAIASYVQHLLPKLRYQLPFLSVSQKDCDHLTSIALMEFFPKIHINRNTAKSIVHGSITLGGLAIPNIHTVQGIDKLHLFLSHLTLQDYTGALIAIDLSFIKLISGSQQFILNEDPSEFRWIESGWMTSLWDFTHRARIQISYPNHWLPKPARGKRHISCSLVPATSIKRKRVENIELLLNIPPGHYTVGHNNSGWETPTTRGQNWSLNTGKS